MIKMSKRAIWEYLQNMIWQIIEEVDITDMLKLTLIKIALVLTLISSKEKWKNTVFALFSEKKVIFKGS